ncbi:MAG: chromosomal replication initiator protein DnaA [Armatimonadetes bacterium]|nr:chromosomal replication initiator protein DnaA [Armatimonadota bacterium]
MSKQYTLYDTAELIHLRAAWDRVLKRLSVETPTAWFNRFLVPLRPVKFEGNVVTVEVPGRFCYEWVTGRFSQALKSFLEEELGHRVEIDFKLTLQEKPDEGLAFADTAAIATSGATIPGPLLEARMEPNPRFTFDNFVVGQSNRMAHAGAKMVAAAPGSKFNPLFIYGPSGLGKTHLLHAIANVLTIDPNTQVTYTSAQTFAEQFIVAIQNNKVDQFRKVQRNTSVWLVDDIQFILGKDKTQEEIFHTYNTLHSLGKQIVICADRSPRELFAMDERLKSRFEAGLVADIQMPDTETRCAIVLSKALQEHLPISHEVAMYLADNVPGNIRILEGALTKLALQSSLDNRPIDIDLAKEVVSQHYQAPTFVKPSAEQVLSAVARQTRISVNEIKSGSRKAPIAKARHIGIYVTREVTHDSWNFIAGVFGNRDHTSALHGYNRIQELIKVDPDLDRVVNMLIREFIPPSAK